MQLRENFSLQDAKERAERRKLGEMEEPHEVSISRPTVKFAKRTRYENLVELQDDSESENEDVENVSEDTIMN